MCGSKSGLTIAYSIDTSNCAERIKYLVGVAPADLEILKQLQAEFAT
jgi:hypothetical protein